MAKKKEAKKTTKKATKKKLKKSSKAPKAGPIKVEVAAHIQSITKFDIPLGKYNVDMTLEFTAPRVVSFALEDARWTLDLDTYALEAQPAPVAFRMYTWLAPESDRAEPRQFPKESFNTLGTMWVPDGPTIGMAPISFSTRAGSAACMVM